MFRSRLAAAWLSCLTVAILALPCHADAPDGPLRLVPAQTDFFVTVEQPRQLIEGFTARPAWKQLQDLDVVREYYDSTNFRRFTQLVGYFEKKLGSKYPDLLDRLAGRGVVVAVKFPAAEGKEAPTLLVIQGKDEKLTREFLPLAIEVLQGELARQESKEKLTAISYRGVDGYKAGKGLFIARIGPTFVLANMEKAIHSALDLHLDGPANSMARHKQSAEARKILPSDCVAWLYLNLEPVKNASQFKVTFDTFTADPAQTLVTGAFADVIRRSPFLCGALTQDTKGYSLKFRLPRGREGMAAAPALLQPEPGKGTLPLLEPRNVLASFSYHLELAKFWDNREKILNEKQLDGLGKVEKNSGAFLGGVKLSQLIKQTGPHQRFVIVQQDKSTIYKTRPLAKQPAYALVQETSDPVFGKNMETVLRAAALLAGTQFNLKVMDEKHGDVKLVGYTFPDGGKLDNDPKGIRYNFSPCFAQVGDQFFVSSTVELGRELIDVLRKEGGSKQTASATMRTQLYSAGAVALLRSIQEQLITQAILGQALEPATAREQVSAFLNAVEQLGNLRIDSVYGDRDYRLDIRVDLSR